MNMTDVFYEIAKWFEDLFRLVEKVRLIPSVTFIVLGLIAFGIWLSQMKRYDKEAEKNGTLK